MTRLFDWFADNPVLGGLPAFFALMFLSAWSWHAHPALTGAAFGFVAARAKGGKEEIATVITVAMLVGLAVAYGTPSAFRWEGMAP